MTFGVIDCPDCGQEVSARAIVCIHCGGPLLRGTRQQRLSELAGNPPAAKTIGDLAQHARPTARDVESAPVPSVRPASKKSNKENGDWLATFVGLILSPLGIGLLLMFFLGLKHGRK